MEIVYSDLMLTLTCISTGGPATTVTWTRDSDTVTEGTKTVLDDSVTAQYTHTLTVTGRLGGLYTCTVANDKLSNDSVQVAVQGTLTCIYIPGHLNHTYNLPSFPTVMTVYQNNSAQLYVQGMILSLST